LPVDRHGFEDTCACGVLGEDLIVRVGSERYAAALCRPHVRPMDFTGRPLTGFVYVARRGLRTGPALAKWLREAAAHAATLPAGRNRPKRNSRWTLSTKEA